MWIGRICRYGSDRGQERSDWIRICISDACLTGAEQIKIRSERPDRIRSGMLIMFVLDTGLLPIGNKLIVNW